MKVNEAPEKIYLEKEYPNNRILPNGISYSQTSTNIEYTRTDAFIERAIIWISNNCYIPHSTLEDFEKYMKGE